MGQSIQREAFMLKKVASGLMPQISRCDHISSAFGMEKGNHTSSDYAPATEFLAVRNSMACSLTLIWKAWRRQWQAQRCGAKS